MVNVWAFADPYYATASGNPAFDGPVDHAVRFVVAALFETKFYLLFSFLFGYSFTLQMASAERDGVSFVGRMLRRVLGLAVLGAVHASRSTPARSSWSTRGSPSCSWWPGT